MDRITEDEDQNAVRIGCFLSYYHDSCAHYDSVFSDGGVKQEGSCRRGVEATDITDIGDNVDAGYHTQYTSSLGHSLPQNNNFLDLSPAAPASCYR